MITAPHSLLFTLFSNYVSEEAPGNYLCAKTTHREGKNPLSLEVCCCKNKNRKTLVSMSLKVRSETAAEPEPPSAPGEPKACVLSLLCVFMCAWSKQECVHRRTPKHLCKLGANLLYLHFEGQKCTFCHHLLNLQSFQTCMTNVHTVKVNVALDPTDFHCADKIVSTEGR